MDNQTNLLTDLYQILDREEQETAFSASGRRYFQWLNWFGYSWLVASAIVGASWGFSEYLNGPGFSCVLQVFVHMTILCSPFSIATYILIFSSAWGPIRSTLKQERAVRKLGYGEMLVAPWRAERAKRRFVNNLTSAAGPFVLVWGFFFTPIELLSSGSGCPHQVWPAQHPWWPDFRLMWWPVYLCSLYVFGLGAVYVVLHLYRRAEERLGVVQRLRESLDTASKSSAQDDMGSVRISAEVKTQIAQIERKQIWQDRAASTSKFDLDSDIKYVVQKGRAVREAQFELDAATSLRVQDEIEILAMGPTDSDTTRGDDSTILWRPVPQTPFELGFSEDNAARRIRVLALQKVIPQDPSSREINEP